MTNSAKSANNDLKAKILVLLDENRVMSVATVRPDGWPQATMVGYVHDDLTLYFSVAANSQKFANIKRDPRISIALGRDSLTRIRGLSMAAHAAPVSDPEEAEKVNEVIRTRHPNGWVFAPREDSSVLLRASPNIISLIDLGKDNGHPELIEVTAETAFRLVRGV
ncbi:MAG TPA: pyridoxamine 5'-phosphate oxidase family protein, partial [Caulobacteraceae bacterium]|jgi:general stress protein 26